MDNPFGFAQGKLIAHAALFDNKYDAYYTLKIENSRRMGHDACD